MRALDPNVDRRPRLLPLLLAGLLIAFAVWCLVLLARSYELRADLDRNLGWSDEIRRLGGELERHQAALLAAAGDELPAVPAGLASRALAEIQQASDPGLSVAARSLLQALARLEESGEPDDGEQESDALWGATTAAREAVAPLLAELQARVTEILRRLDHHWTSLNLLVLASLLLAGSNLALLQVAHRRRRELEKSHAEISERATHDPLTGLWNRSAILRLLREELARAGRSGMPVGVILADLDGFHQVNVQLGQDQGDFILEQLARRLETLTRPYDTLGRLGGDSFLLVLPACDGEATAHVAERLGEAVNERDVDHGLGKIRVTVTLAHGLVQPTPSEDGGGDPQVTIDLLLHRLQEGIESARERGPGQLAALEAT